MANAWHFVSNKLKFHLFHATSPCCHSNMSKSKVKYDSMHDILISNNLKFHLFHAKSVCCDSNMSKSKVIYG